MITELASEHHGEDVLLLDIRPASVIADYFVLCSGTSERHLRALAEAILETAAQTGERALRVEGSPQSGWILIDFGSVIVHIFSRAERDYYRLERLWTTATPVLRLE